MAECSSIERCHDKRSVGRYICLVEGAVYVQSVEFDCLFNLMNNKGVATSKNSNASTVQKHALWHRIVGWYNNEGGFNIFAKKHKLGGR